MDKLTKMPALSAPVLFTSLTHDTASDFLLPEYMPPIRRVVSVETAVLPESRFLSGSALELGGTLSFNVLYVGEDNALSCASVTAEYGASCALGDTQIPDASRIGVDTAAESVTCRVTAPRAFTVRVRMKTSLLLLGEIPLAERMTDTAGGRGTPADEIALERLEREASDVRLARGDSTLAVQGVLNAPAETKILRAAGTVRIEEAVAAENAVRIRGEVILHTLCVSPEGRFVCLDARSSLAEEIPVPGALEGDAARAWARCAAVTVRPTENAGSFTWEAEYDAEAETARETKQLYTADAYSTDLQTQITAGEADSLSLLRCGNGALTVSGEGGRQSAPRPGETVLETRASAQADHCEIRDGQMTVHGMTAVSVLLCADGDVVSEEFTLPFRWESPLRAAPDGETILRCSAEAVTASARVEGDKLAVTVDLSLSTLLLGRKKIRAVREIVLDRAAPQPTRDGVIRICYPDPGESLWEIAKRYAVRRSSLGESEVSDGTPMLV